MALVLTMVLLVQGAAAAPAPPSPIGYWQTVSDITGQRLTIRGYIGISLFGRSQVWHRLP